MIVEDAIVTELHFIRIGNNIIAGNKIIIFY